jgi:hypothetical protein
MTAPEIDSPFDEKKSNPLIWIIPSVALHIIVLVFWLTMPEEAPREQAERKMTINSSQALRLQQHVEDANILLLQSQVSELQAIKSAMAQIREDKMAQLRSFEEQMIVTAPTDATELFTRLLQTQVTLIASYQQMLESAGLSIELKPKVLKLLEAKHIAEALPQLIEVKALWDDSKAQMSTVQSDTATLFALINTGEITLEWMSTPGIQEKFLALKKALDAAQEANNNVSRNLSKSFSGRPAGYLNDLITKNEAYAKIIDDFAQANIDGKLKVEAKRAEQQQIMAAAEAAIEDLTQQKAALSEQIKALAKSDKATLGQLNWKAKETQNELIRMGKKLGQAKATLKKIRDFRPNNNTQKKIYYINKVSSSIFVTDPDLERIVNAIETQTELTRAAKELLTALENNESDRKAEQL